ncbi:hypothetical protein [Saccharopolyspora shandongensis]|uniref:hypothetical protein n=1 Tax=Saccharopolyspora shandongensis TaxID=418495 RepID=UPI0033D2D9B0
MDSRRTEMEAEDFVCGESFDRDEELIAEGEDGSKTFQCRTCGAELFEGPDND